MGSSAVDARAFNVLGRADKTKVNVLGTADKITVNATDAKDKTKSIKTHCNPSCTNSQSHQSSNSKFVNVKLIDKKKSKFTKKNLQTQEETTLL